MEDSEAVLFCCFKIMGSSPGCGSPWQTGLADKIILLTHFFPADKYAMCIGNL